MFHFKHLLCINTNLLFIIKHLTYFYHNYLSSFSNIISSSYPNFFLVLHLFYEIIHLLGWYGIPVKLLKFNNSKPLGKKTLRPIKKELYIS